jgi:type I restriction enzyme R subunit
MLKEAIKAYEEHRISETQYLHKVKDIMNAVLSRHDSEIPAELQNQEIARAFYGLCSESFTEKFRNSETRKIVSIHAAIQIDEIIQNAVFDQGKPIIDWQNKSNITGKLLIEIGDYLIDDVREKYGIDLSFDEMDIIAERCIDVAKIRYK